MFKALFGVCLLLCWTCSAGSADKLTVAAASDLKFAMDEIVRDFEQQHPGAQIDVVYGSSGKFHTQIQQGAPYDLYFSADIAFPRALAAAGFASSAVQPYALGRIVLWSASLDASSMTLSSLSDQRIAKVAIANPQHAPYGQRAVEALKAAGVWEQVQPKLVYGDNIAHATQFVQTGNAQVGITALALALSPSLVEQGGYWPIPEHLHTPLEQGYIITTHGADKPLAHTFANHMRSTETRAIMMRYGFVLPSEAQPAHAD